MELGSPEGKRARASSHLQSWPVGAKLVERPCPEAGSPGSVLAGFTMHVLPIVLGHAVTIFRTHGAQEIPKVRLVHFLVGELIR
jgi:hypothetical protein